jgi:hypothetical protein
MLGQPGKGVPLLRILLSNSSSLSMLLSSAPLVSLFRSFVGSHISAFNLCKSQFRERVSQSTISLKGYGRFRAYPCVDERVFAAFAWTEAFGFGCEYG